MPRKTFKSFAAILTCAISLILALPVVAPSQAVSPQDPSKTLISVKIKGANRYKENAIIAASGLQIGMPATEDDFKKAARALGDTGAFTDIAFSYSYSSQGTRLELKVTEATKFLPAHFEDFVWFSDDQLQSAIKSQVPMFDGELPAYGQMANEVSNALQTLLVKNGIPGTVDYIHTAESKGHIEAFDYTVSGILILVHEVEFTGVGGEETSLLAAVAKGLADREYSRTHVAEFAEHQLLPVLHTRGFIKASFGPPQTKVVKLTEAESGAASSEEARIRTFVDVSFAVDSGLQYKFDRLEWSGNRAFPADQLQTMIHLKPGQPANSVMLADNLAEIRTLYGSRGYVNASIKIDPQFNDAAKSVVFQIAVNEDSVYHMGELQFRGLDNSLTAKLREAWKLREGEVFDAGYLQKYLPQAHKLLPATLDWEVDPHVTPNIADKTVDVDLQYTVKAPR